MNWSLQRVFKHDSHYRNFNGNHAIATEHDVLTKPDHEQSKSSKTY